ncbi:MAG: hypothetical protein V4662_27110 [Verrucomicrobiota bacterium]
MSSPPPIAPWRIKAVRCIFGIVGLGLGILLVMAGYYHQLAPHEKVAGWVKTPCRILNWGMEITHGPGGDLVKPTMTYEYTVSGKTYKSSSYDEATDWVVDMRDFEEEGDAARRGPAFCYVDPKDPRESSFRAAQLWYPWSLVGGGGLLALISIVFLVRTFMRIHGISTQNVEARVGWLQRHFVLGCSLTLLGFGGYMTVQQGIADAVYGQIVRSKLIPVPARVEARGVHGERGSGKNSHQVYNMVHLVYSYEHAGRRWYADRWYFDATEVDGGTKEDARALAAQYPLGLAMTVWIHPDRPWYATLDPGLRWHFLWFLFPLGLIGAGLWFLRARWGMRGFGHE